MITKSSTIPIVALQRRLNLSEVLRAEDVRFPVRHIYAAMAIVALIIEVTLKSHHGGVLCARGRGVHHMKIDHVVNIVFLALTTRLV
jgi:hypothetical protein